MADSSHKLGDRDRARYANELSSTVRKLERQLCDIEFDSEAFEWPKLPGTVRETVLELRQLRNKLRDEPGLWPRLACMECGGQGRRPVEDPASFDGSIALGACAACLATGMVLDVWICR